MRVGVMMCAFREARLITPAIHQFDGTPVEEVVVACSAKPWMGPYKEPDHTAELAIQAGATVRRFPWDTEADQKNWIQDKLAQFDWVIMAAPDMYLTKTDITNLFIALEHKRQTDPRYPDKICYACHMETYWKDYDHVIDPPMDFKSVVVRPSYRFFSTAVVIDHNYPLLDGVTMHHLSWVKTDEEVKNKITTYHHAPEIIPDWFERVWQGWEPNMHDLGPTVPNNFGRVIEGHLPQEIRELIATYKGNL